MKSVIRQIFQCNRSPNFGMPCDPISINSTECITMNVHLNMPYNLSRSIDLLLKRNNNKTDIMLFTLNKEGHFETLKFNNNQKDNYYMTI